MSCKLRATNKKQRIKMSKEIELGADSNLEDLLSKEGVSVVRFTAPWCGPCRMIAPIFEELADGKDIQATFIKCDTDVNKSIPTKFGVRSIPYVIVLDKDQNILADSVGAKSKDGFIKLIQQGTEKLANH